jgi:hypothetical protein
MYWGPVQFSTRIRSDKRQEHEEVGKQLSLAFPKFARARVVAKVEHSRQYDPEEGEYSTFGLSVVIPLRCRVAAFFEDADYSSPVWFPTFAFGSWIWVLLLSP